MKSVLEASANTTLGYVTAICTQLMIFPIFNIHVKFQENLTIGACFTVVSLLRSYVVRRVFNRMDIKKDEPKFEVMGSSPWGDGEEFFICHVQENESFEHALSRAKKLYNHYSIECFIVNQSGERVHE